MKKLIVRRLVSGIINTVIGLIMLIAGLVWITSYGVSVVGNSLGDAGFFGLVQGVIYISTANRQPRKWLETIIGILGAFNVVYPFFNSAINGLALTAAATLIIFIVYVVGAPLSKKGYPDMPYKTKAVNN
ncbi:hypothetical protein ACKP2L_05475 [Oenococcus alcoholitolerans]|uniref:Phage holin family protein n=1 Tax=Oenococcus alcoholitolerans TaxID=931074 RepID=A0ABR4XP42_9LACO|nr:hypothetical protein Q757_08640 [Oenococcus alcoholitolerans]